MNKLSRYFLGCASPTGFRSKFGEFISDSGYNSYIIKGGPGTGKSSLIKRIADEFPDEDREIYHCSSDPDSLDAVMLKGSKIILADGTPPHIFEPQYPGAVQRIVDLGAFWDVGALRLNKPSIIARSDNCQNLHAGCKRVLTALSAILGDVYQTASSSLIQDKLDGYINRLYKKIIPKSKSGKAGATAFKQRSAITPKGYMTFIPESGTVFSLNDAYFAGADYFLKKFGALVLAGGYDVEISPCALHSAISGEIFEHMSIPELDIHFISSNEINKITDENKKPVNFMRFYDKSLLSSRKFRLRFNFSAAANLKNEAVNSLALAKSEHDALELFYIGATDFNKQEIFAENLLIEIKSK